MDGASSEQRRYPYSPLDSTRKDIRLLDLNQCPSIDSNIPMRCRVRHVSLLEEPIAPYYAISYCWGESIHRKSIILDEEPVDIPESAEKALRGTHLSSEGFAVPIWIDALCIDQHNLTEKGHQVAMMREVYSSALEVRVWLGEKDYATASAIHTINTIVDLYSQESKPSIFQTREAAQSLEWNQVHRFLNSPWFSRLWPVQEVVLAKQVTILCGEHSISWERLAHFVRVLSKHSLGPLTDAIYLEGGRGILNVGAVDQIQRGDRSLSTLLIRTLAFKVSDPRDKIYAIFGFLGEDSISQDIKMRLSPDYNIQKKDLFIHATSLAMRTSRSLRLLRYAQVIAPSNRLLLDEQSGTLMDNEGFPSWVPRYDLVRSNMSGSPSMVRDRGKGADFSLASNISCKGPHLEQLCVAGVSVSKIMNDAISSDTSSLFENGIPIVDEEFIVSSLRNLWIASGGAAWTKQFLEELADTFLMGGSNRGLSSKTIEDFEAMVWKYRDVVTGQDPWRLHKSLSKIRNPRADPEAYVQSARNHVINRAAFLDSKGNPGLGQLHQKPGDEVCILFGCSVPLILHPDGDTWRLIGDAYISGMMRGEYIQMLQREGRLEAETRMFVIQ